MLQEYFPMHEGVLGRNMEAEMRAIVGLTAELFAPEFTTRRRYLEERIDEVVQTLEEDDLAAQTDLSFTICERAQDILDEGDTDTAEEAVEKAITEVVGE